MRAELAAKDVPFVLSTFIVKYRRSQDRATQIKNADVEFYYMPWMSIDGMLDAMDVYNQAILDYATRAGLPVVDDREAVPADADHFSDCMHFLDKGAEAMADRFARYLVEFRRARSRRRAGTSGWVRRTVKYAPPFSRGTMKRTTGVAMALALTVLATMRGQQPQVPQGPEYVPGEVLVQYARAATPTRRAAVLSSRRARLLRRYAEVDTDRVQLAAGESLADALRGLPRAAGRRGRPAQLHPPHRRDATPNDPQWASLWGMMTIQMPQAWDLARGDGSVVIMDIDTGIDYNHEDLAANVWNNPGETANGVDDDGDGYVDDLHGINTITGSGDPLDDNGHGTHTAGTLAAVGNNGKGVVGVNWNAKIIACKFLDQDGSGNDG